MTPSRELTAYPLQPVTVLESLGAEAVFQLSSGKCENERGVLNHGSSVCALDHYDRGSSPEGKVAGGGLRSEGLSELGRGPWDLVGLSGVGSWLL